MAHATCHPLVSAWASDFADFFPVVATRATGIRPLRNKCSPPVPLKSLGSCLECYDGTPAASNSYLHELPGAQLAAA